MLTITLLHRIDFPSAVLKQSKARLFEAVKAGMEEANANIEARPSPPRPC